MRKRAAGRDVIHSHGTDRGAMPAGDREIERLGVRLRYRVRYELGFGCPDIEDIVQETLRRYLESLAGEKVRTPEAAGAFVNGVCRNVIAEYRRRLFRDAPMPETPPEPPANRLPAAELFQLQDSIAEAMGQLSPRDQQVLRAFYLEERPVEEILETTGLSLANFRVVICRAKERFRQIYSEDVKSRGASAH
jgi:RNA polymerase sigma-70 factor, ECF subfamily